LRKRQKRAIDVVLETTDMLLEWPEERAFLKAELWQQIDERTFRGSLADLRAFQWLEERGYSDVFLARYPSLHKYFAVFLHLPFTVEQGNDSLLHAIDIIRPLDAGTLKGCQRALFPESCDAPSRIRQVRSIAIPGRRTWPWRSSTP
jgi:hypothetical protein